MADSTLIMGRTELREEVAFYLGFGRESANWSTNDAATIDSCIKSGLRQFYFPPMPQGVPHHRWRFLTQVGTLATVASTGDYDLPDAVGAITGDLTYANGEEWRSLKQVGELSIREKRQQNYGEAAPRLYAIRPKAHDGTAGPDQEILLWPTPGAVYNLSYRYDVRADALTALAPYPYGAVEYGEVILASCLAVAERRVEGEMGVHWQDFLMGLAGAIARDRALSTPDFKGYNGNSERGFSLNRATGVTYNGVEM